MPTLSRALDYYISYRFIRELTKSWTQMDAYKLGIIDEKGNILKKSKDLDSQEERNAYTPFNRLVWNLKKLLEKLGGRSKITSYSAAAWMLKEHKNEVQMEIDKFLNEEGEAPTNVSNGVAKKDSPLFIVRRKKKKECTKEETEDEVKEERSALSLNYLLLSIDPYKRLNSLSEKSKIQKRRRKVVRGGKVRYKIFCPPGKKAVDGRCVTKTAQDRLRYKKASRLRKKKMAGKAKTAIFRKAKKSNRRRKAMGLNRK